VGTGHRLRLALHWQATNDIIESIDWIRAAQEVGAAACREGSGQAAALVLVDEGCRSPFHNRPQDQIL
jgi:hypothetical protein